MFSMVTLGFATVNSVSIRLLLKLDSKTRRIVVHYGTEGKNTPSRWCEASGDRCRLIDAQIYALFGQGFSASIGIDNDELYCDVLNGNGAPRL